MGAKIYRLVWTDPKTGKKQSTWWQASISEEEKQKIEKEYGVETTIETKEA